MKTTWNMLSITGHLLVASVAVAYLGCGTASSAPEKTSGSTSTSSSSSSTSTSSSSSTGSSSSGAGGSGGQGGSGGGAPAPAAILCPETDALHPKNANTVLVLDNNLTADAHWTADKTYVISVPQGFGSGLDLAGHTLTIDAGTIICLDSFNHLGVGTSGAGEVHINGTADKPVVITSMPSASDPKKPDQFNGGLILDAFQGSTVSYLDIFYGGLGGGGGGYALKVNDTAQGSGGKLLKLDHVWLDQLEVRGVYVGTPLGIDPTSTIHVQGFAPFDPSGPALDAVAQIDFLAGKSLSTALTIDVANVPADAAHITLRVSGPSVDGPAELSDLGVPYFYHDVLAVSGDAASLTLHEGVTLGLDNVMIIGDFGGDKKGDLIAVGTAQKPVTLTSSAAMPAAQDWGGVFFTNGEFTAASKIDNAKILYAGFVPPTDTSVNYCSNPATGAVMIEGSVDGSTFPGPAITNTLIAHSAVDGIVAGANVAGSHVSVDYTKGNITFTDVAGVQVHTAACQ